MKASAVCRVTEKTPSEPTCFDHLEESFALAFACLWSGGRAADAVVSVFCGVRAAKMRAEAPSAHILLLRAIRARATRFSLRAPHIETDQTTPEEQAFLRAVREALTPEQALVYTLFALGKTDARAIARVLGVREAALCALRAEADARIAARMGVATCALTRISISFRALLARLYANARLPERIRRALEKSRRVRRRACSARARVLGAYYYARIRPSAAQPRNHMRRADGVPLRPEPFLRAAEYDRVAL